MSEDIKQQMKIIFKNENVMFALQLDESTDISGLSQFWVFIRFIHNEKVIEQFLCCQEMLMRTTGEDIFKIVDEFMKENNLLWTSFVGICTDGAPSMVGSKKGFTALAKKENEKTIFTHCFLHHKNLVAKTIGNELKEVMNQVVQMVNYILNVGLFNHVYLQKFVKKWEKILKIFYYTKRFVGSQEEEYFVEYTN